MAHPQLDDALREYTDICRQRIELYCCKARIAMDDAIMHALDTSIKVLRDDLRSHQI